MPKSSARRFVQRGSPIVGETGTSSKRQYATRVARGSREQTRLHYRPTRARSVERTPSRRDRLSEAPPSIARSPSIAGKTL